MTWGFLAMMPKTHRGYKPSFQMIIEVSTSRLLCPFEDDRGGAQEQFWLQAHLVIGIYILKANQTICANEEHGRNRQLMMLFT